MRARAGSGLGDGDGGGVMGSTLIVAVLATPSFK
jgi:hypothetical protein